MNDTAGTPALDVVMHAACGSGWPDEVCEYPKCDGDCRPRRILAVALSAAFADTPEVIETMARAMCGLRCMHRHLGGPDGQWGGRGTSCLRHWEHHATEARAALRALRQLFLGEG